MSTRWCIVNQLRKFSFIIFSSMAAALPCFSPAQTQPIPQMFNDRAQFLDAIEKEKPQEPNILPITGITVPHHLLAADLIARGFWAAASNSYERIIVVAPDHFYKSKRPLATTTRDIETVLGTVQVDKKAASELLSLGQLFDDSDLFKAEHGIAALLPFIKHFFPDAKIVPIVASYGSTKLDWERAVQAIGRLVVPGTLVVQSTDYSHYLKHAEAVRRDQETLNIIAADDLDAVGSLVQPAHLDTKAAQYIQMKLQAEKFKSHETVIANRSSSEYSSFGTQTTSYIVTVYSPDADGLSKLRYGDQDIVYFGGDTFIGRWFTQPLIKPKTRDQVIARIRAITNGAPMVINLEGAILDDPPPSMSGNLHFMHASLAIPILKALNVKAVSLANNHSHDLGVDGLDETRSILSREGIGAIGHMGVADLGSVGLIAANFIGSRDYKGYPAVRSEYDLEEVCRLEARSPLVAFVHWGTEYTRDATSNEYDFAQSLHNCGVNLTIGAHSHQASARIEALQGGEYAMVFSLGNLMFDQKGSRSSGALIELRAFKQGTFAARLIPLPNLYDLATSLSTVEQP